MRTPEVDRRSFLAAGAAAVPALGLLRSRPASAQGSGGPVVISSGNGLPAVTEAMARLREGAVPIDAVVAGITLVEDDPDDMSVGLGGLPNEEGVVQLDASVMDGPSHKGGAVAALERIRNPAQVALKVLRETDHVLLVGDGARRFAVAHGFREEDLLTDRSREAWLRRKQDLSPDDDWLDREQQIDAPPGAETRARPAAPFTWGTIHCAALSAAGNLGAATSTSGLSFKIPGRVGDSPIIGAGMYVDNGAGAAGATGRGEAVIQSCGAFQVVQHMARGDDPTEACLKVLRWIAAHTKRSYLRNKRGEPNFSVVLYALRKDGAYGSACMRGKRSFAVHDGSEAKLMECASVYE